MKTVIEMAREAGIRDCTCNGALGCLDRFASLVRADERARMAEQPAQQALDKMAENARELGLDYEPAQQEPVAWRNVALRVGEDLCSVGPFGYYDMTAEQWLDWALSVVTVHAPPAQRTWVGLSDEEKRQLFDREDYQGWLDYINAIEAKLKEKNT